MSDHLVAGEVERLADRLVNVMTDVEVPTMRDRFAVTVVANPALLSYDDLVPAGAERYARQVYDLAVALDAERRRRNEEDGR